MSSPCRCAGRSLRAECDDNVANDIIGDCTAHADATGGRIVAVFRGCDSGTRVCPESLRNLGGARPRRSSQRTVDNLGFDGDV